MVNIDKLGFYSQLNYMKRSAYVGSGTITFASAGNSASLDINHSLGYIPFFIAGAEIDNDGIIWSNDKVNEFTNTSLSGFSAPPKFDYWTDENIMTINLRNGTSPLNQTGARKVYWGIYLDYKT